MPNAFFILDLRFALRGFVFALLCFALLRFNLHCFALHPLYSIFDNLECPGNFVATKNAKPFSTIKNAEGNSLTTKKRQTQFLDNQKRQNNF